ncbi:hypothetical protein BDZ90DRAFT_154701 [Jaminaea rosea]|uniref:Uncharacterized protein n=1 Tax=Jaminaea rosea TaxID=1569628 RepID=A0A316UV55_9BASI|nr:hypothetical protein BDZ90DRAFT_154701 [Jaminaea rosea]PWN28668.1 hypothetical protein BDZ90DRAFT_154701 [Jaminaea rosea]
MFPPHAPAYPAPRQAYDYFELPTSFGLRRYAEGPWHHMPLETNCGFDMRGPPPGLFAPGRGGYARHRGGHHPGGCGREWHRLGRQYGTPSGPPPPPDAPHPPSPPSPSRHPHHPHGPPGPPHGHPPSPPSHHAGTRRSPFHGLRDDFAPPHYHRPNGCHSRPSPPPPHHEQGAGWYHLQPQHGRHHTRGPHHHHHHHRHYDTDSHDNELAHLEDDFVRLDMTPSLDEHHHDDAHHHGPPRGHRRHHHHPPPPPPRGRQCQRGRGGHQHSCRGRRSYCPGLPPPSPPPHHAWHSGAPTHHLGQFRPFEVPVQARGASWGGWVEPCPPRPPRRACHCKHAAWYQCQDEREETASLTESSSSSSSSSSSGSEDEQDAQRDDHKPAGETDAADEKLEPDAHRQRSSHRGHRRHRKRPHHHPRHRGAHRHDMRDVYFAPGCW